MNPLGEFPLNDDWAYSKSILIWLTEGKYDIGEWPAMTLFTHLLWGILFTKAFGFSFFILRLSTIISSLIGVLTLFKLVNKISKDELTALLASLIMLFNPLYFNLTNTYMTDVNFNTLLVLSCYFAFDFFQSNRFISLVGVFISSIFMVLLRQFGIVIPAAFLLSILFLKNRRWFYLVVTVCLFSCVLVVFKLYENYLIGSLSPSASYKFSGKINPTNKAFWDAISVNLQLRYSTLLLHILCYVFPFAFIYLFDQIKIFKWSFVLIIISLGAIASYLVFSKEYFPYGNVFINMALGAETFYESLNVDFKNTTVHTYSKAFETIMASVKYLFTTGTILIIVLGVFKLFRTKLNSYFGNPSVFFFLFLFALYTVMLLVTESYFDRYHLPLITLGILLLSFLRKIFRATYKVSFFVLVFMFYVSAFGTKDYLSLNRCKWNAYKELKKSKNIGTDLINGGFEINCWDDGKRSWWHNFLTLDNYKYLIQYRNEKGFKKYKEIEFQRYFPYKKDKIYIFVKEEEDNN